jgi:serine/threonine-protein kinase
VRRAVAAWAYVAAALSTRAAGAQTTDDGRADALFKAAQQLQDGGQLAEACPMFAEAKHLGPGVGVTLHLADCYEKMGRTASARDQFREAEQLARDRGDERRAAIAHTRAQALELKLGRLTVAAPATPHPGWDVRVDGVPWASDRWNSAVTVDPGDHVVTVNAPGRAPRTLQVTIDQATLAATVRIDEVEAPTVAPAAAPVAVEGGATLSPQPAAPEPSSTGGNTRLWVELGLVGIGAAGVGLGTAWLIKKNEALNSGTACDPAPDVREISAATTIAYVAGGVALASALVVYLTAPHRDGVGLSVAPALFAAGGGATVHVAF